MDIDVRLRRSTPLTPGPGQELQHKVLAQVLGAQGTTPLTGWMAILQGFAYYLVRYPIPVLTLCWVFWLLSARITIPFGTEISLAQILYVMLSWR